MTDAAPGPPALSIRHLSHAFEERRVLEDVSFDVAVGETFGLLGPNGSGKSTLLALLAGLRPRQGGEVSWHGVPQHVVTRELRSRLGVVFQSPSLDVKLTARQNLRLAARLHGLDGAEGRRRAEALLSDAGLADRGDDRVSELSGGMKRRLDLARVMMHEPDLLLMDEPTSGLDEAAFRETWRALEALRVGREVTLLVATHRPEEAERCHRLGVLVGGRLAALDTPAGLRDLVKGDVVVLTADAPDDLAREVHRLFGMPCVVDGGEVVLDCERGHELIPRLVEALPSGRLTSVSLRRPTLADAFLKVTGRTLDAPVPAAA